MPEYARSTYDMVTCAFGGLPPPWAYWSLVALLDGGTSMRGLANLLCLFFAVDYPTAYHDAMQKGTGYGATPEEVEAVRQRLLLCGYVPWPHEE
jgi:hypothetical protein